MSAAEKRLDVDSEKPNTNVQMNNMTKRSMKKLRRFRHQLRLEKKTISTAELKQLPNYCQENINETEYYYQDGLQKVYPYYFNFSTYVKGRWMGKTILDVCSKEFLSETPEYYKKAIEDGRITINGKPVKPDFILGDNHLLQHTCHRHENPIKQADLEILVDKDDVLVVNKPSSWPIHPCGRYRYNSLMVILQKQYGYQNLRSLYRLDRLTSGVFIMAKTSDTASRIFKDIEQRRVQKEYVARVVGHFPDGVVECNQSLSCISHKLTIYKVDPKGKESSTTFERLSYNGKTSVVKCMPHTGRTHQIRLHLQYLGHPIVNDSFYNSEAFGPSRGKGGVCDASPAELEAEILKNHNVGLFIDPQESRLYKRKLAAVNQEKLEMSQIPNKSVSTSGIRISSEVDSTVNYNLCKSAMETEANECVITCSVVNQAEVTKDTSNDTTQTVESDQQVNPDADKTVANSAPSKSKEDDYDNKEMADSVQKTVDSADYIKEPPEKRIKLDINELQQGISGSRTSTNTSQDTENLTLKEDFDETKVGSMGDSSQSNRVNTATHDLDSDIKEREDRENAPVTSVDKRACDPGLSGAGSASSGRVSVIEDFNKEKMYDSIDVGCKDCQVVYVNPAEKDLIMYLHAYRYKGPDWEYSTPLPDWAQEDWQE